VCFADRVGRGLAGCLPLLLCVCDVSSSAATTGGPPTSVTASLDSEAIVTVELSAVGSSIPTVVCDNMDDDAHDGADNGASNGGDNGTDTGDTQVVAVATVVAGVISGGSAVAQVGGIGSVVMRVFTGRCNEGHCTGAHGGWGRRKEGRGGTWSTNELLDSPGAAWVATAMLENAVRTDARA